ncbi:MAG: universal stress protein, partial [Verrucomicrobia bacterium]|nr:universal stress protein [Verrucomicrobiota bacterium]
MQTLEDEAVTIAIKRVLVAVDLSDHSAATAAYAAGLARNFGASLTVVHVYEPVPVCEYANETTFTLLEEERGKLKKLLEELTLKVRTPGLVCEPAFLVGNPVQQIIRFACDIQADLIVTASHHRTFLGRLLNLDKAPQIMHRAPCPVLVYHEKKARAFQFETGASL